MSAVRTAGVMITYGQHVANKTPDSVLSARPACWGVVMDRPRSVLLSRYWILEAQLGTQVSMGTKALVSWPRPVAVVSFLYLAAQKGNNHIRPYSALLRYWRLPA